MPAFDSIEAFYAEGRVYLEHKSEDVTLLRCVWPADCEDQAATQTADYSRDEGVKFLQSQRG